MEFTDFMIWKFAILCGLAFIAGLLGLTKGR
jgi:hypothetical protein